LRDQEVEVGLLCGLRAYVTVKTVEVRETKRDPHTYGPSRLTTGSAASKRRSIRTT